MDTNGLLMILMNTNDCIHCSPSTLSKGLLINSTKGHLPTSHACHPFVITVPLQNSLDHLSPPEFFRGRIRVECWAPMHGGEQQLQALDFWSFGQACSTNSLRFAYRISTIFALFDH